MITSTTPKKEVVPEQEDALSPEDIELWRASTVRPAQKPAEEDKKEQEETKPEPEKK